jgi:hypothetical protein
VKNLTLCFSKPSIAPIAYNFLAELVTKVKWTDLILSI